MDFQGSKSILTMEGLGSFTHNEGVSNIYDVIVQQFSPPFNTKKCLRSMPQILSGEGRTGMTYTCPA